MLEFYLVNGVITPPAMVGVFTGLLMNSFHQNIIKPLSEKAIPSHNLDPHVTRKSQSTYVQGVNPDTQITNNTVYNIEIDENADKIRWQTFLRDLILWFVTLFIFYIFFKFILKSNPPKAPN
jgi:large-conductance mechanosensitive channel